MNSEYKTFMFFVFLFLFLFLYIYIYICVLSYRNQTISKCPSNPPPLLPNFPPVHGVVEAKVIPFMLG